MICVSHFNQCNEMPEPGRQGAGERCVLAARADPAGFASGFQCAVTLILCDAIGSPLGSAPVPFEPNLAPGMLAASATHAAAASAGVVFLCLFRFKALGFSKAVLVTHAAATSAGAVFLWRLGGGEDLREDARNAGEQCCWVLDLTAAAGRQVWATHTSSTETCLLRRRRAE